MLDYAGCVLNNWERLDPAGRRKSSPRAVEVARKHSISATAPTLQESPHIVIFTQIQKGMYIYISTHAP